MIRVPEVRAARYDACELGEIALGLPDPVVIVSSRGEVLWANRAAERGMGRSLDEWRGADGLGLIHPDDFELAALSLTSLQGKDVGTPIELRIATVTGWTLVELIGSPIGDDGDLILTMRDLTQRRRWEVAGDDVARFRSLVHNAASLTMLVNKAGIVESSSGAITRVLGLDPERICGRALADLVVEADQEQVDRALREAVGAGAGQGEVQVEAGFMCRDGGIVPFELSIVNLLDDPTVEGLVVTGHDIRRLRETLSLLGATLESTADGILVVDPDGRITRYNRRFAEMWRLPESLLESGDGAAAQAFMRAQLRGPDAVTTGIGGGSLQPETEGRDTLECVDGRVFERSSKPQRVGNATVGTVWSFHDATERTRLGSELAAAVVQAQEASQLKSAFLATMSHEIRTPMNGVVGMANLILDTDLDEIQRRYLLALRDSGNNLMAIINDILDFSKIEAGKLDVEEIDFDLDESIDDVVSLLSPLARDKGLALRLDVAADVPSWVRGDPLRLRQVLINLVSNAVKFTESGTIAIAVASVGPGQARFSVSDTGIGVDQSAQATLLDPFAQADSSTTRRFGGTGLGLAICAQLVELMGGRLEFDSRLGKGSVFWFDIALVAARGVRRQPTAPAEADGSPDVTRPGARILLADDADINQIVGVALLERLGYRVDIVSNGAEALAAVQQTRYDAVLMDCLMPVMDGYEATARIRTLDGAARRTPIIAITASAMVGDREKCLAVGMNDYVSKPLDPTALAGALARCRPRHNPTRVEPKLLTNGTKRDGDGGGIDAGRDGAGSDGGIDAGSDGGGSDGGIDAEIVEGLRKLELTIGSVAYATVCATFVRTCPTQVGELNDAVAAGDVATVRRLAHKLKGGMASFGAVRLSQLAATLEITEHSTDQLGVLAAELVRECARVEDILRRSVSSN